ncbi:MAG: alpha/beta hydrolase [Acidimicrobiia bacterium]|nr:alpha/beta hydrolase [Acidimicrobiia bacterium]
MSDALPVELVRTRSADGVLLHGALVGRGARQGVLAVHGAWGSFYGTPVFDLLPAAAGRGLVALSLNGRAHDLGSLGDGEPCIGLIRDRFEDAPLDLDAAAGVLTSAGAERYVVVGHSFGSAKVAYWLAERGPAGAAGLVLVSPAPALATTTRWFVEGALEHHVARAAAAIAAGEPHRLVVLSSSAPVPMVAEAATVLSLWGPGSLADPTLHVPRLSIPVLVTVGDREPSAYRERAERVADAAADAELVVLPGDHYYDDREALVSTVLDWVCRRGLLDLEGSEGR